MKVIHKYYSLFHSCTELIFCLVGFYKKAKVTDVLQQKGNPESTLHDFLVFGPLIVTIQINSDFYQYKGNKLFENEGIFESPKCCNAINSDCGSGAVSLTSVLVVGYGKSPKGKEYWILKQPCGTDWGCKGFIYFKKGTGHCGIAQKDWTIVRCKRS